jgi:hypothetical protein
MTAREASTKMSLKEALARGSLPCVSSAHLILPFRRYDDRLYQTECVRYLRGEPITDHLVDRELAAWLDEQNGPA